MNNNNFTPEDRACVNCKHLVRKWDPFAILDAIFSDGSLHYLCKTETNEAFNRVTGKVKVKVETRPCKYVRNDDYVCGELGTRWEPNNRFLKRKENLFKVLKNGV